VPAVLEMLGIPCTGPDPLAIGITLDKALGKLVAKAHGIPTAPWVVAGRGSRVGALRYPLFVKPAAEGSSMGITARSICRNEGELDSAVSQVSKYGAVLIEEFLNGEEFTVGIVAGKVVGVMQVVPRKLDEDFIYSIEVKRDWQERVDYRLVDQPRAAAVAMAIWNAFDLRDVARVDVRVDRDGIHNFVEVNPLPGMHPTNSDLILLIEAAGWTYNEMIAAILGSAEERWRAA
jgi:D-alanine-D-alanine ligase